MSNERSAPNVLEVKPLRFYEYGHVNYQDVQVGDVLLARGISFGDNMLSLEADNISMKLDVHDYGIKDLERAKKSAVSKLGRKVLVRVSKKENGVLYVERNSIACETTQRLNTMIGSTIPATIEAISNFALFVDLGNGVESMVPIVEISENRFKNIKKEFEVGSEIRVKIQAYDAESDFFTVSRKRAYLPMDIPVGEKIVVTCAGFMDEKKTAIFVSYDPGNVGLMNVPHSINPNYFNYGDELIVRVTKYVNGKFKCAFVEKI